MLQKAEKPAPASPALQPSRTVYLIGSASSIGCPIAGAEQGPVWLAQQMQLTETLKQQGIAAHWQRVVKVRPASSPVNALAQLCQTLADSVAQCLKNHGFFSVIGGDHACAIGTWNGVYRARAGHPFGLIWVDAHMDSHTPQTSHSGALHGMPLACLLGYGDPALTGLANPGPVLEPQRVCLIGVRSYEPEEQALLEKLGVRIFHMQEIQQRGLPAVMREALAIVSASTGDFGVSIDLDAFDPALAPGVSTPAPGGLQPSHLQDLLAPLRDAPGFLGLELAEYNPRLDQHHKTAELIGTLLSACVPSCKGAEA